MYNNAEYCRQWRASKTPEELEALRAADREKKRAYRQTPEYRAYRADPAVRQRLRERKARYRRAAGMKTLEQLAAEREAATLQRALAKPSAYSVAELVKRQDQAAREKESRALGSLLYSRQKSKLRKAQARGNYTEGHIPGARIAARFARFGNRCAYCGAQHIAQELQIEHVIPLSKGGPHVLANIVPACKNCNRGKSNHDALAWYKQQPFYSKQRWEFIQQVLSETPWPAKQMNLFADWVLL